MGSVQLAKQAMIRVAIFFALLATVLGHGRLMDPPSRASQWRLGFDNPPDYDDNQGYCGGKNHENNEMGGLCGICGDPYDGPWPHQAPGGKFANGNIVAQYAQGDMVEVEHGVGTQRFITSWDRGYWNSTVILPADMTCSQCILQWAYTAGNDWGTCENGTQAVGCGPQEQFRACADIEIVPKEMFAVLHY